MTFVSAGSLYALPLGNPSEASLYTDSFWSDVGCTAWSVRVGFYGDYNFNRHMQLERRGNSDPYRKIDQMELFTNAGYLALNVCDRAELFATMGATSIQIEADRIPLSLTAISLVEISLATQFSWSLGGRVTLLEWCDFTLGIEGQYFRTDPQFDFLLDRAVGTFYYLDHSLNYREWQVGLGISYNFALPCSALAFVPYIGVLWSDAKLDTHNLELVIAGIPTPIPNLEEEKLWGLAIGTTFLLGDVIGITVEGRFASEKALYVNGQFRF